MKQLILFASLTVSLVYGQANSGPAPTVPKNLPPPPSPQEVLAGGRAAAAQAPAVDPNKVVLTVGDQKITAREFNVYLEALPEQLRAQAQGPMKRQMAEQVVRMKLLAEQARKSGLDKDPVTQNRIAMQTENILAGAAYNEMMKKVTVDDAAARKYYDEHKKESEEASARHILIKFKGSPVPAREGKPELSEEQALAKAQEIRKKLLAGGDFAAIAKEESDDTGSGSNGGDLGSFKRNSMVPEFEQVAFSQPIGQVSEPIKTQFGYHLIRVDKRESPSFESMRSQIEERMRPEQARNAVEELAKTAAVNYDEAYFGPAPQPTLPGMGAAAAGGNAPEPAATKPAATQSKPAATKPATSKPTAPKAKPAK
jgi:parvulin-like peptidyl-prolyl isomerase